MRYITLIAALLTALQALAQEPTVETFKECPDKLGGIYYQYTYEPQHYTPAPKGFKAVYISHYGRHGSRFHAAGAVYEMPYTLLNRADSLGMLTSWAKEQILQKVNQTCLHARGRLEELTEQGVREHRGIAQRMFSNFRGLFLKDSRVVCRSTLVPRAINSMAAFSERLKELNPKLSVSRSCNQFSNDTLIPSSGRHFVDKPSRKWTDHGIDSALNLAAEDVLAKLFRSEYRTEIENNKALYRRLVRNIYYLGLVMQISEDASCRIWDLFTPEQRYEIWKPMSAQRYATFGPSLRYGDATMADGTVLLECIIREADHALSSSDRSADLRFGHDVTVIATLAAMEAQGACYRTDDMRQVHKGWADYRITPMASNLQLIFYRNRQGETLVKLLHNERECLLPLEAYAGPYYSWEKVKAHFSERIQKIRSTEMAAQIALKKSEKKRGKRMDR